MTFVRWGMGFNWQRSDDLLQENMRIELTSRPGLRCWLVHASFRLLPCKLLQCEATGLMQGLQEKTINGVTVINGKNNLLVAASD